MGGYFADLRFNLYKVDTQLLVPRFRTDLWQLLLNVVFKRYTDFTQEHNERAFKISQASKTDVQSRCQ